MYEFSKVSSLIRLSYSQSTGLNGAARPPTVNCFYFVREHRLHRTVTGLEAVQTIHSLDDKLDRLLVSFKDAKVSSSVVLLYLSSHSLSTYRFNAYEHLAYPMSYHLA